MIKLRKKYDLNNKKKELMVDIKLFTHMRGNTNDKIKKRMYQYLIDENMREIEYIEEFIIKNGVDIENYDYNI